MRLFLNGRWMYSEDEIDSAYNQGYEDGKVLALEEEEDDEKDNEVEEYDEFAQRTEQQPYHDVWCDNKRCFGRVRNPFCKYHLTKSKIIIQRGLIREISEPILLYRVVKSVLSRTLIQRLFGTGDIIIKTAQHEYVLKNVFEPRKVNAVILKFVDLNRKDRVRISEWATERDIE